MTDSTKKQQIILTIREYENSVEMPDNERVTYLDPRGGVHLKDGDDKSVRYSAYAERCADYLRFGDEVDTVTCGEFPRTSALKICDTPQLYIEAGFKPLPMLYTQRHLLDAIRPKDEDHPHRHSLSVAQVKRIPELLADPVMLYDSPSRSDSMLALLCAVDCDSLPLIAAIKPGGHGYYELHEMETNFILAVYGRSNFSRYFDNLITPEMIVYYNEERGRDLNALAKLHLLRSHVVEPDLCNTIIRRPQCLVKSEAAGQSGYNLHSTEQETRASCDALGKSGTDERVHDREER